MASIASIFNQGCDRKKKIVGFVGLILLGLLSACAPTSKPILLNGDPEPQLDNKWIKYGAYYLIDEIFVETSYLSSPFVEAPINKYIINKKIKILTPEGAKFGTVEVPVFGDFPSVFRLSQWDSNGTLLKFSAEPIRSGYLKTGKIIFPNVTPGSLLQIYIEFSSNTPVSVMEHWFSGPIPVSKARFTFSYLDSYKYGIKAYGPVKNGKTESISQPKDLIYNSYEMRDVYPRSRMNNQDDIDVIEPRVAIAIRHFRWQSLYESWNDLSEKYETFVLKKSFFQSTTKLRKLADSLTRGKNTPLEKASEVFSWVQKNISFKPSPLASINPDKVVKLGQGNMWEMAVVLREMFEYLGFETDILVTRSHSQGGFDPSFVSPIQLSVTFVTVKMGAKTYVAFPWSLGAALGEFPMDFVGLQALSLGNKKGQPMPDFVGSQSFFRNEFKLHPEDENSTMDMETETGGYLAFSIRNALIHSQKKEIEESFQKTLTELGRSNAVLKCDVQGLNQPGRPVLAKMVISNPNQTVRRKGETQMQLSHIFQSYFSSYDTTRASGFKNNLDVNYSETLRIPKIPGKTLKSSIQCQDISNLLFKVTCITKDTLGEFVFNRSVSVRQKKLTAEEMCLLAKDIVELNRIRESSLTWKSL